MAGNNAPVATNDTGSVNEDGTLTVNEANGVIKMSGNADSDSDGDTLSISAIRTGSESGSGTAGTVGSALSGTYGTLTLSSNGSYTYVADKDASDSIATGATATDTFTYTVSDGKGGSDKAEIVITITGTNDAPIIDLDSNDSTTTGYNYSTSYALGKTGVSIGDIDVGISDEDDTNIESATITLTNKQTDDILFASDLPSGITASSYNSSTGVLTLSGSATKADYEKAIEAISFYNSNTSSSTVDRTINVVINDGTTNSNTATTTIKVATNALSISTATTVEEGKSAIFDVKLDSSRASDTKVYLTTEGNATSGTDYETQLTYESSPGTWTNVLSDGGGNYVIISSGDTSIDVKIKTISENPAVADDGESLTLKGTIDTANSGNTSAMANTVATASTIITEYPSLTVNAPNYVKEGNNAIFEVSLTNTKSTTTAINLALSGDAVSGSDYNATYQYSTDEGSTWTNVSGNSVTLPANTSTTPSVLIKVVTIDDNPTSDDNESLVLTATTSDSNIATSGNSASDSTTIIEPLTLSVTEEKDNVSTSSTSVTTSVDAKYNYEKLSDGANGTVTDNGDGTLTYSANTDFSGTDTFNFIKIDKTTGERIVSTANVNVNVDADTPDIEINASVAVVENIIKDTWYIKDTNGSVGSTEDISVNTSLLDTSVSFQIGKGDFIYQKFDSTLSGTFDVDMTYSGGTTSIYLGNTSGTDIINIVQKVSSVTSGSTVSVDMTGYDTIIIGNTNNSVTTITNFTASDSVAAGSTKYDINIENSVSDLDGSEVLGNVTLSGIPTGSTLKSGSTEITVTGGSATITQAQLSNLTLEVPNTEISGGNSMTLTASVEITDTNPANGANTDTATANASVTVENSDKKPIIGDASISVSNSSGATQTVSSVKTTYGDGANKFSWDPSKSEIPDLYANGKKVEIEYDNVNGTVKGTIDDGATTVFTATVNMNDSNATTVTYTQGTEVLGVQKVVDGDIILPGGGNNDYRVFQFTDSNGSSTVVVDALVSAHNLIEDSAADLSDSDAEHTVNTNNYYIGVDSNNMNAGQQLVFDFARVATYDGITTSKHDITELNIKLFNFGSEKSGDELYITVYTVSGSKTTKLTQDSDYDSELRYTVKSESGEPITKIEFLAGNESSFKLGIESIGSVDYSNTFEMELDYDITDTDTGSAIPNDTDTGKATIKVGTGTVDTSLNSNEDSSVIYNSSDDVLNAGAGIDTLILGSNIDIDFNAIANDKIQNIEEIDLSKNADHTLDNLSLADLIGLTDGKNDLIIYGDSSDNVNFKNSDGWTKGSQVSENGKTFDVYSNSGDSSVSVKVETSINDQIL